MKKRGRDGRGKGDCPGTDRKTHDDLDDDAQLLLLPARRALAPRRRRAGGPSCRHRPARRAAAVGPACRAAAVGLAQPRPPRSHMPALLAAAPSCSPRRRSAARPRLAAGPPRLVQRPRTAPIVGHGRPEPDKQAGLHGLARHERGPWARAWAVGAARGLARHGPLGYRAGLGTAREKAG